MTAKLKTITASKADLEKEIDERRKAEKILKARTEQLEHTQKKLEENARMLKYTVAKWRTSPKNAQTNFKALNV